MNLAKGLITVKPPKDKPFELVKLVELLKEVGFQPVTEVTLELRGRLVRREGKLWFEAMGTGQKFAVEKVEGEGNAAPEEQLLIVTAVLADPHSPGRLVVRQWKPGAKPQPKP